MRNYESLNITYCVKDREEIEKSLPKRVKVYGGTMGPGFEKTKSTYYTFEPPLTKLEILGIIEKLAEIGVKAIEFRDTLSLGEAD